MLSNVFIKLSAIGANRVNLTWDAVKYCGINLLRGPPLTSIRWTTLKVGCNEPLHTKQYLTVSHVRLALIKGFGGEKGVLGSYLLQEAMTVFEAWSYSVILANQFLEWQCIHQHFLRIIMWMFVFLYSWYNPSHCGLCQWHCANRWAWHYKRCCLLHRALCNWHFRNGNSSVSNSCPWRFLCCRHNNRDLHLYWC